jgi:hypothetical protein
MAAIIQNSQGRNKNNMIRNGRIVKVKYSYLTTYSGML